MFDASRIAAFLLAAALVSACSSTNTARTPLDGAPPKMASAEPEGTIPDYCPKVSLREGTAILRKGTGDGLQYVASIVSTSRSCRLVNGELRMKVGVAGRVVPGPAAAAGPIALPIRIAVVRNSDVLYSTKGTQTAQVQPGQGGDQFVYVDEEVAVPEPTAKNLVIYAGFDEGPA